MGCVTCSLATASRATSASFRAATACFLHSSPSASAFSPIDRAASERGDTQ